ARLDSELRDIADAAARLPRRPRVFFEEWHDPLISGIRWVDELIETAGGQTLYRELRHKPLARDRILDPAAVAARDPEIVIGSWCGARFRPDRVRARPGWSAVSAVAANRLFE